MRELATVVLQVREQYTVEGVGPALIIVGITALIVSLVWVALHHGASWVPAWLSLLTVAGGSVLWMGWKGLVLPGVILVCYGALFVDVHRAHRRNENREAGWWWRRPPPPPPRD